MKNGWILKGDNRAVKGLVRCKYLLMQLPCVIIRVHEGIKGLNFNQKQTKISKNPGKNIISQIIHKAVALYNCIPF